MIAPELFDVDDEGYAVLLREGPVPKELQEKAQLCADNCPEWAIEIIEDTDETTATNAAV